MEKEQINSQDIKFAKQLANMQQSAFKALSESELADWNESIETWKLLQDMREIEQFDTGKAWNKLYSRFESDNLLEETEGRRVAVSSRKWLSVAASIVVLFGILSIGMFTNENNWFTTSKVANNELSPKVVTLPDGSTVNLNYGSKLVFNKNFGETKRNVKLTGEAFFDVQRNENVPFNIEVNGALVTVLGTSFNINSIDNGVEVIVKSGKVKLSNQSALSESVILEKNDRGVLQGGTLNKTVNPKTNYLGWLNKQLVFKEAPLIEAISDINKAFHVDIELEDTSLNNLLITTNFTQNNLNEVLESIALAFNLEVKRTGKKHILEQN